MRITLSRSTRLLALGLLAAAAIPLAPMPGVNYIPLHALWTAPGTLDAAILRDIRIPRALTAFCAGSALALSGAAFQSIFRNPLATPFTLGVAGGAALGGALYIRLGPALGNAGVNGAVIAAFIGSLLAISLVYGLTRLGRGFSAATLLLAGVAANFFFSSALLFTQYTSGPIHSFRIVRWMMGSVDVTGYDQIGVMLPFITIGAAILAALHRELNLLAISDDLAASRGVEVDRAKKLVFLATSLMVGGVVSVCGPIGFVGMMAPHICRLLLGHDHRFLLPGALLAGGILLMGCDTLARTLIAPAEMPVGVITALLGGPFFLWLLIAGHKRPVS